MMSLDAYAVKCIVARPSAVRFSTGSIVARRRALMFAVPESKPPETQEAPKPKRSFFAGPFAPVVWLLVGVVVTLGIVLAIRLTQSEPRRSDPSSRAAADAAPRSTARVRGEEAPETEAELDDAGRRFAGLYLTYLMKSYYTDARGFCDKLLVALCKALVSTDLIANEERCQGLPNSDLVLAIGRYQHHVGLPVDGKAGPETVRAILGGEFGSRREMASTYCPGSTLLTPSPSSSSTPSSSAAPSAVGSAKR